jgi:hypothetical protein
MNLDDEKNFRRYGAELLFTVDENDLPTESSLRKRKGGYTSLFKAKWMNGKLSDEPYEIPCILGAFYFTSKDYYNKIHGWDTEAGKRYCGHHQWGSLEPYISLKSWLVGGGCTLYPDIEAGHVFSRIDKQHRFSKGVRSAEWMWWNSLFMAGTMILDDRLRLRLYNYVNPELNLNVARKMIMQHNDTILRIRERNRLKFKNTPEIFETKFGYKIKV